MARTTIRTADITDAAVTGAKLEGGAVDTSGLEDDVALLGFKVASNGSLAKYNLVDQTVDAFEDTSGVDASTSTNEVRDASGKYYSGQVAGVAGSSVHTAVGAATWTCPTDVTSADILIVAGGAGGGGAGGVGPNANGGNGTANTGGGAGGAARLRRARRPRLRGRAAVAGVRVAGAPVRARAAVPAVGGPSFPRPRRPVPVARTHTQQTTHTRTSKKNSHQIKDEPMNR